MRRGRQPKKKEFVMVYKTGRNLTEDQLVRIRQVLNTELTKAKCAQILRILPNEDITILPLT